MNNTPNNITEVNDFSEFSKRDNNNKVLNIATFNTCGINTSIKQWNLIDTLDKRNIHILGLSETKLSAKQAPFAFTKLDNSNFKFFYSSIDDNPKGQGVGILIHSYYARYIHAIVRYKGRILYLDLFMK